MHGWARDRAWAEIREDELTALALELGKIPAPSGHEGPVADYLEEWLQSNRLPCIKQEVYPERYNVLSYLPGRSGRTALLFNSHIDSDLGAAEDAWVMESDSDPLRVWQEQDRIYGHAILNDRGPLACFLMAALAIKKAGITLEHELLLTATVGEIGMAPVDEFQGYRYIGKGIGARHLVTHGGLADYAVVAETTDFSPVWAECGVLYFKLTVYGDVIYVPRLERPQDRKQHPNAVIRAHYLIEALENWAEEYQSQYSTPYAGGWIIPKISIGAIRGGAPPRPNVTSGICHLYLDVMIPPGMDPQIPKVELKQILERLGYPYRIECYLSRMGYIAQDIDPLLEGIRQAHFRVFGQEPGVSPADVSSMWRDINVFNEVGIPALNYGPPRRKDTEKGQRYFLIQDLVDTARVYADLILTMCGVHEERGQ